VLESQVFGSTYETIMTAVRDAGHDLVVWQDAWWETGAWPSLAEQAVVFHGSLGNAARVRTELPWRPGAFCDARAFHCTEWYPRAAKWLLHRVWRATTVRALVESTADVLSCMGTPEAVFVRPDSPLKPFSGRVMASAAITLDALDFGFYYEDNELPIVVTPVRSVAQEWRYVVVSGHVVAGSGYAAPGRSAVPDDPTGEPWSFAAEVASAMVSPEPVYVMDVCRADGSLHLLELNPFSGADLYACDPCAVVMSVSEVASRMAR